MANPEKLLMLKTGLGMISMYLKELLEQGLTKTY